VELPDDALDLHRFDRLRKDAQAALAAEELHLLAVEERVEADLVLGRGACLIGELEALAARHPLRECPRGPLMRALYRAGRQADALAGYRAFRETLASELGIEPSPGLRDLERRILQQDLALDPVRIPLRTRSHAGSPAPAVRQGVLSWSSPSRPAHGVSGSRLWQAVPTGVR
jgi:DNA-binding SARP family transcriptional activator